MKFKLLLWLWLVLISSIHATYSTHTDILSLIDTNNVPPYVKEVITINLRSQILPDARMRQAFWFALSDYAPFTEERVSLLRLVLTGPAIDLLMLFYEDTLYAIETQSPVKSHARHTLEDTLLSIQAITPSSIEKFETLQHTLMAQAHQDKLSGETQTILTGFLDILHKSKENLDLLFIPIPTQGIL